MEIAREGEDTREQIRVKKNGDVRGGDATSGPGPGPYLAPPLFVAPQHCASLHLFSLSLYLSISLSLPLTASPSPLHALDVLLFVRPASLRDQQRVSMIPSSRDEDEKGDERVPLSTTVASFRDVSIDFISRGCITAMRPCFKVRS